MLEELLRLMEVPGTVEVATGGETARLNVRGSDLGVLIGRRGEKLASLQHIVNLIVAKKEGEYHRIAVDVENYRGRREEQLRDVADRAAKRVLQTGKIIQLEPMPAIERRIVHMALVENGKVFVDRPKAVLQTAQRTKPRPFGAVEHHETIDHVFEHFWPGKTAFLRHVTDENHDRAGLLREPREERRRFAHLRDATRHTFDTAEFHDLYRIEHDHRWMVPFDQRRHFFGACFGGNPQLVERQLQAARPHRELLQRLFAGDIQHLAGSRERSRHL